MTDRADRAVWVVIPWRPGCLWRHQALDFVHQWWMRHHPSWRVAVGVWPEENGPWRKGCAVRAAGVTPCDRDVVVVADADVIPTGIGDAVERLTTTDFHCRWASPFTTVYRLNAVGTRHILDGSIDLGRLPRYVSGVVQESYRGTPGGGVVALRGRTFTDIPIDPRFGGYGQEDMSWSLALHRLAGAPTRVNAPLWHLWHPPQPRLRRGPTTSRGVGSVANLMLWQRYREATTPDSMRSLVAEARAAYTHP